jgi:hypothetical protein
MADHAPPIDGEYHQGRVGDYRHPLERPPVLWLPRNTMTKPVRCAIYTRVSTDQGHEQDFNSLDAQYDAGAFSVLAARMPLRW